MIMLSFAKDCDDHQLLGGHVDGGASAQTHLRRASELKWKIGWETKSSTQWLKTKSQTTTPAWWS